MSELIKKLLDYQEVDLQLKTIEDEILKTEEAQKYYAARKFLSTVKDTLQAFEDKAEKLLIRYNNALKEVDEMKKTAAECKAIVESCEDESELNYISKKFKSAVDALSRREQEINDVIKEMEDLSREVVKLNKQNKVMREQFAAYKPKFEELRAQKTDDVKALKDKMDKIFNKFYQCDESHASEGNGIGLAIVKRIVDLHGGKINVTSEGGVTAFSVELPKAQSVA